MKITTVQAMIAVNATRVSFYDNVIRDLKFALKVMKAQEADKQDLDAGWKNVRHAEKQRAKAVEQQLDMKSTLQEFSRANRCMKMIFKLDNAGVAPDFSEAASETPEALERQLVRMTKLHFPPKADSRTPEQITAQVAASAAKKAAKEVK